mgnify:CR=1 FL=1
MKFGWVRVGLVGAVVLAELVLRISGPLPSMAAEYLPFVPDGRPPVLALRTDSVGCVESDTGHPPSTAWTWLVRNGDGPPLKLLALGDSVTIGQGVEPSQTWAVGLAERLSAGTGRSVSVVNAGVNASGYCGAFRMLHHQLVHESFDKVVIGLFADDLEQRAVTIQSGMVRANPEALDGWVGRMATYSYVFNWAWLQVLQVAVVEQLRDGEPPPPYVVRPGRSVPAQTLTNFRLAIQMSESASPLFVLNPPAGQSLCTQPLPDTECDWMAKDMDLMAQTLSASGVAWVDNRALFEDPAENVILPIEGEWYSRDGRLPVHPNALGHHRIAASIPASWFTEKP